MRVTDAVKSFRVSRAKLVLNLGLSVVGEWKADTSLFSFFIACALFVCRKLG
jgi:hypothetical protein